MKRLKLILILLLVAMPLCAIERKGIFDKEHMNVSVYTRYQSMLDWHDIYNDMLDSHTSLLTGVQVGLDTHPSDGNWWAKAYNYPSLSFGFSYDHSSLMKTKPGTNLGDFLNLYLATEFDFFRIGSFSFGPVLELGVSYCTDTYNPRRNISNKFIGSNILADLSAGIEASLLVHPHWEVAMTGYFVHHSNGMTNSPNLGTNQLAAGAKLKYYLAEQQAYKKVDIEKPHYPKGFHWNVYTAFGGHSCDWELNARGPEAYPVKYRLRAILGVEASYRYHRLFSTGLAIEGNYADHAYKETDLLIAGMEDPSGYSPFYTSLNLSQYFHYSNFSVNFTWGVYTYKKTGMIEDIPDNFQRIGVRYHLPPFKIGQAYLSFGMRAHHFDRSYCLEFGTGITF